eukprot:COSAG01_NODE_6711_length_3533_cov_1.735294_1_plen_307_part_00
MRKQGVREVEIDGLVVLKIIKHCRQFARQVVTGQLLGLDEAGTMEVTNCFALPNDSGDDPQKTASYQTEMMTRLREVNVDSNTVGWYQSASMGQFQSASVIESQYNYQSAIRNSVIIVFDPKRSTASGMCLKAFRLTDTFMEMFKQGKKFSTSKCDLPASGVFEELPIKVKNSFMIAGLLQELAAENPAVGTDFTGVEQASETAYVETSLERMCQTVDDLTEEQRRFQMWQRDTARLRAQQEATIQKRRAEGKEVDPTQFKEIPEPSRLEGLMITNQIDTYATQLSQLAAQGMSKAFLMRGLASVE